MFKVRQYEARTLSWWRGQRKNIDFDPPYQRRGGLWSRRDKAYLVDSILNEYDIPKIYLADFTYGPSDMNPQNRQYAVIDGKQRFEAINDFFDGKITLDKEFQYEDDLSLRLGGLGYQDLQANYPEIAARFENFNLTVMTVITDEEGKINELFVRLNRNKTLTGPEIRNAMQGVVPELIRQIASDSFFEHRVTFSIQRGADLDGAAKLLLVEFRGRIVETKRVVLDRFVEEGRQADAGTENFERAAARVRSWLDVMNEVFLPRDSLLGTQGQLVPYYWLIRHVPSTTRARVRSFLVAFEEARSENRRLLKDANLAPTADPQLSEYDRLNRSINDVGSIEGRFEILSERLSIYLDTDKVEIRRPVAKRL